MVPRHVSGAGLFIFAHFFGATSGREGLCAGKDVVSRCGGMPNMLAPRRVREVGVERRQRLA